MSFISLKKISTHEAWKIRLILFLTIIFSLLITIFYPFNIFRYFLPEYFNKESSCVFYTFSGIPCAFCGMSHSLYELAHLNFERSIYYNPSSVIFLPFLAVTGLSIFVLSIFKYKISVNFDKKFLIISILILLLIWMLNIFYGHIV